jgi:SSS family solute:Na+ symporter
MTLLDYLVIAAYFLLVVYIGLRARRSVSTSDDFFLAGRGLPLWLTGLSFMAANLGSFELMGFVATAAKYGMFTAQLYWWGSVPAMIFAGLVMVRCFYATKVRSVPEFLRTRFDEKCRTLNAISFAFLTIFTSGLSLYGLAVVFHALFQWDLDLCIWISASTVLLYIMSGGLRASIYTEVLQFFIMLAGILPLSIMILRQFGGLGGILAQLPENMRHAGRTLIQPETTPFGEGFFALYIGLGLASFAYWSTDFLVIQRALAARDIDTAAKTPLLAAFPKMLFPILTVVPGLAALLVMPARIESNYNLTLPLMLLEYYPAGLLGLGFTALLSSFMAGMAGNVTAFNTVWTYDIYQPHIAPNRPDRHYLLVGRLVTIVGILISVATAYSARSFPNMFDYWALLSGIFVGAPFGTFVVGVFTRGLSGTSAFAGMLAGILTTCLHYVAYRWAYLHYGSALAMDFSGAAYGFFMNIGVALILGLFRRETVHYVAALPSQSGGPARLAAIAAVLFILLNVIFW